MMSALLRSASKMPDAGWMFSENRGAYFAREIGTDAIAAGSVVRHINTLLSSP